MTEPLKSRIQVFDPDQEFTVVERRLPHWSQAGTISFITWRTWDSIPAEVLQRWLTERDAWLKRHGIDPNADWRSQLRSLSPTLRREFQLRVSDRWNEHLDACHGACVLRRLELAQIVSDSLLHFDGDRYELTDLVVMPNHVHLLVAFPDEHSMLRQCDSWKHFTATQINRALNRKGRFWEQDGFDHLVRSPEQFLYLRRYIADNPRKARLQPGEFIHWSKPV
jgi:type I restriction enzyme R subunit